MELAEAPSESQCSRTEQGCANTSLVHQTVEDTSSEDELNASKETEEMKSLKNIKCPFHPLGASNKIVIKAG
jgi:hypothetical protein